MRKILQVHHIFEMMNEENPNPKEKEPVWDLPWFKAL
jgi:hypothetical protein